MVFGESIRGGVQTMNQKPEIESEIWNKHINTKRDKQIKNIKIANTNKKLKHDHK